MPSKDDEPAYSVPVVCIKDQSESTIPKTSNTQIKANFPGLITGPPLKTRYKYSI